MNPVGNPLGAHLLVKQRAIAERGRPMWLLHLTLLLFVTTTVFVYSVVEPLEARNGPDELQR